MARNGFQATVGTAYAAYEVGRYGMTAAPGGAAIPNATLNSTLSSAIATAVADGASPTQAHVTAINDAYVAMTYENVGDVSVTYDTSKVTTLNQLKQALEAIINTAAGSGLS